MSRPYGSKEWKGEELSASSHVFTVALPDPYGRPQPKTILTLAADAERYRYTLALSPLILWVADAWGGIIDIDARGLDYTGLVYPDYMGTGFLSAIHEADRAMVKAIWQRARHTGDPLDYEVRLRAADGGHRWHRVRAAARRDADGSILCWYGTIEDVDDRKLADQAIQWAADHDELTGLWNRRAFMRGLKTALNGAEGSGVDVALVLIDLDQFKALNDQHGHTAGDTLLQDLAHRLEACSAGDAMPARLGGDEFALFIFTNNEAELSARIIALKTALAAPYIVQGETHFCRASIGVALHPGHGHDASALYQNADLALYEAKSGGHSPCFFQGKMRAGMQARLSQISLARHALDNDEIIPFYQPKINLETGKIAGFEALLRWTNGSSGIQTPGAIPAAFEDAELAVALDERMFERLTADIADWIARDIEFGRIAFNISAADFRRDGFVDRLLSRVQSAAIPPSALEIEVTETVFLGKSTDNVAQIFRELRKKGFTIALDDFGTGYASLAHLKKFPIDVLKIDCSFTRGLEDPTNAAIVRSIIGLGRDLGITTVAEGVETPVQANRLRRKGCNFAQGYLFSPAVSPDKVPDLLADHDKRWRPSERRSGSDRRSNTILSITSADAVKH